MEKYSMEELVYHRFLTAIKFRVWAASSILLFHFVIQAIGAVVYPLLILNLVCIFEVVVNIPYYFWLKTRKRLHLLGWLQFAIDLTAIIVGYHYAGAWEAPLVFMYLLPIIIGSYLLTAKAVLILAVISVFCFSLEASLEEMGIISHLNITRIEFLASPGSQYLLSYLVGIAISIFLIAGLISYLNTLITKRENELTKAYNDLKDAQAKLVQSEKMGAAILIASETAHEIKNPLSVINSGLYLLEKIVPEENVTAHQTIQQSANAVTRTIQFLNDLLNFSRPPVLALKAVDVHKVIEDALNELPQEMLAGIEIEKDFAPDIPLLNADPDRLKQVVVNLVKNATEAIGEVKSKKLKVKSEKEGEFVKISVSDTGRGMAKENLQRIFDPFFTTKGKGTGLGLAICQRIIEAHKGEIEVTSEVGKGTTFVVKLPGYGEKE